MTVKLLTEQHLEFLSSKRGCTVSTESIHVKMPYCWKSRVATHICLSLPLVPCSTELLHCGTVPIITGTSSTISPSFRAAASMEACNKIQSHLDKQFESVQIQNGWHHNFLNQISNVHVCLL